MPKYYRVMRSRVLLENSLLNKIKNYFFSYITFVISFLLSLFIFGFLLFAVIVILQAQEPICYDYMMGWGQQEVLQVYDEYRLSAEIDNRLTEEERMSVLSNLTTAMRGETPDGNLVNGIIIGFGIAMYICIIGFFILKVVK